MYLFTDYFAETEQDLLDSRNKSGTKINVYYVLNFSPELFEENLKAGLSILGAADFMSYKDVSKFNGLVLNPLLDLLEEYDGREQDEAKDAAGRMIKILEGIPTDDDMFPKYEIENLKNSVKSLL
jgi:hypothetical protein